MARSNFPQPSVNRVIDNDPQIVRVPMDQTDWGGSKRSQPKDIRNGMSIKHVGGSDGKGK